MAIGEGFKHQGKPRQGAALSTGSKLGVAPNTDDDSRITTDGIFSGLQDIRKDKGLLNQREKQPQDLNALWKDYKETNGKNKIEILKALSPTIDAAITNIVGGDRRYITRARLIALNSLDGFDPNQGTSLNTYVYNRLQSLKRLSADRGNFIHVPEKSALERRQLEEIKRDYMLENGVEPSLSMLADKSGFPLAKVGRLMSIFGTTSTSVTRGEHGDSLEAKKRTANELYIDTFYNELSEIDKKIYEWSTGYRGSPKLDRATMASRLGISEAAISQHAHKIDKQAAKFNDELTRTIYGGNDAEY